MSITIRPDGNGWLVSAPTYRLHMSGTEPKAILKSVDDFQWTALSLLSSVHRRDLADESLIASQDISLVQSDDDTVVFEINLPTAAWETKTVLLSCTAEEVRLRTRVVGVGAITDVTLGGGDAIFADGASGLFRSGINFSSVFVPGPTEPVHIVRSSSSAAALGIVGDASSGRLNGIFAPPPLVFAFGRAPATEGAVVPRTHQPWLAALLSAPVQECTFTQLRYEPLDGGWLMCLSYEAQTRVDGEWISPTLVLRQVAEAYASVDAYRNEVGIYRHSSVVSRWWREPIFCGWGAQCAAAAAIDSTPPDRNNATTALVGPNGVVAAPALSCQSNYDMWLSRLENAGVIPGTIVIDDRWQVEYGTCTPDTKKWPNLSQWIKEHHHRGQKILLWFKSWDPSGLPLDECILDPLGRPIAADPSNPRYRHRLRESIRYLLSPQGLDADGLKIDFTQRAPSGQSLTKYGSTWGIALLHRLLSTIYDAAKEVKADALLVNHTVNPLFADTMDMVRLNDVLERDTSGHTVPVVDQLKFRHAVASRALPDLPIDTDQWPMPNRTEWLAYCQAQATLGVPALYYVESIDNSAEPIETADLEIVASVWRAYRDELSAGR